MDPTNGFTLGADPFGSFASIWGTAATIGADPSLNQPRTAYTVPTNAFGSMQPATDDGGGWGDFWKDTIKGVVGYAIVKDAKQSGVDVNTGSQRPAPAAAAAPAPMSMLPMLMVAGLVGAVVWAVARKG